MSHVLGASFLMLIGTLGLLYGVRNLRNPMLLRTSFWTGGVYRWIESPTVLRAIAAIEFAVLVFIFLVAVGFAIAELRAI